MPKLPLSFTSEWHPSENKNVNNSNCSEFSVADMVAQAAYNCLIEQELPGYIYNKEYGTYYNHELGYHFYPEASIFYHVSSQQYYYYNSDSGSYEFYLSKNNYNLPTWRAKRFKKRAERLFGKNDVLRFCEDQICVAELLLELTESCAKFEETNYINYSTVGDDYEFLNEVIQRKKNYISDDVISDDENDEQEIITRQELLRKAEEENLKHAPCIRLVEIPATRTGLPALHIITITGAMIGFGSNLTVSLNPCSDSNYFTSMTHEFFSITFNSISNLRESEFESDVQFYELLCCADEKIINDLRLELNGEKISSTLKYRLQHKDCLTFVSPNNCDAVHSLFIHLHVGLNTCTECELGLLLTSTTKSTSGTEVKHPQRKRNLEVERRQFIRQLKNEYGLNDNYSNDVFADRKRKKKSNLLSDNSKILAKENANKVKSIYDNCKAFPISGQTANSVVLQKNLKTYQLTNTLEYSNKKSIESVNKGFKLLQGMGWKEGQGLGKDLQGIQKPVDLVSKSIFDSTSLEHSLPNKNKIINLLDQKKNMVFKKMKQRYYEQS